jgi:hypothetical protein
MLTNKSFVKPKHTKFKKEVNEQNEKSIKKHRDKDLLRSLRAEREYENNVAIQLNDHLPDL